MARVHRLLILLLGLAQFERCAENVVSLPLEDVHAVRRIEANAAEARFATGAGEELTLISGREDAWLERSFTRGGRAAAALPEEWSWCGASEWLVTRADGNWWYSRCAGGTRQLALRIVTSLSPSLYEIPVDRDPRLARGWVAVRSGEMEGVLLTLAGEHDERRLRADHVTSGGAQELGTFERSDATQIGPRTWQAHRLDDFRIALVSLEFDDRLNRSIALQRTLTAGGVSESRLPFDHQTRYLSIASALSASGSMAIVAATRSGVEVMIIDPNQPTIGRARPIGEGAATDLQVIAAGARFIAAWRSSRRIELVEFDARMTFPGVTLADDATSLLDLRNAPEGIDVYWTAAGGIAHRRLPQQPTGYIVASEAWLRLRDFFAD